MIKYIFPISGTRTPAPPSVRRKMEILRLILKVTQTIYYCLQKPSQLMLILTSQLIGMINH